VTPRIVLDSNVIVSGLGWSGPPARILDATLDGSLVLVTSPPLLAELRRVLAYPKLARLIKGPQQLVDLVEAASIVVIPLRVLDVVSDESDNRVLEAAVEGAADYIVSGDDHLLTLGTFQRIPVLAPGEFVASVLK
jgi:putative PIN family toxin of toxin-antitoxin system